MATTKQLQANTANAKCSTGPRTDTGKRVVSGNRVAHGVLSARLLLPDESADEYQALEDGLRSDLNPVGTLEFALVERIAAVLWRQYRLISAETSSVAASVQPRKIAEEVGRSLCISEFGADAITLEDLEPPDPEQIAWCRSILEECRSGRGASLDVLATLCPLVHAQLLVDAGEAPVAEYLREGYKAGLEGYLAELARWCGRALAKAERHPEIQESALHAIRRLAIPWGRLELISRYHASLDNQLYKALRALRDAQAWRTQTSALDGEAVAVPCGVGAEVA